MAVEVLKKKAKEWSQQARLIEDEGRATGVEEEAL